MLLPFTISVKKQKEYLSNMQGTLMNSKTSSAVRAPVCVQAQNPASSSSRAVCAPQKARLFKCRWLLWKMRMRRIR